MNKSLYALTTALVLAVCTPMVLTAASEDESAVRQQCANFVAAWNKHDPKAMAAIWADDGDVINPFGRIASGRAEIEKLFTDEHNTVMHGTTYATESVDVRLLGPTVALVDWSSEITGMHNPTGVALPVFKHHVFSVFVKKDGQWKASAVRPYVFLPSSDGPPTPPSGAHL